MAEIKDTAKEQVLKVRGASAISLLKSARAQCRIAEECELEGNTKGALSALTKAASLVQMFMDSAEFKQETQPGRRGVLMKDFFDFQQVCYTMPSYAAFAEHTQHEGRDLMGKTQRAEERLNSEQLSTQ